MMPRLTRFAVCAFLFALTALVTSACADEAIRPPSAAAQQAQMQASAAPAQSADAYVLGVGDKLRLTVFDEPTLSGDFDVSSTGMISLPLIGEVQASQRTVNQLQEIITHKLSDGYMRNPHVNLEVLNYRPFFILGEVMKPGSYNYVNGMTVINAVAMAGGYTYRADKDAITLKHGGIGGKEEHVNETTTVTPGDVVNVPERYF